MSFLTGRTTSYLALSQDIMEITLSNDKLPPSQSLQRMQIYNSNYLFLVILVRYKNFIVLI